MQKIKHRPFYKYGSCKFIKTLLTPNDWPDKGEQSCEKNERNYDASASQQTT